MLTEAQVLDVLRHVKDPELNRSVVDLNMVRDIHISKDGAVSLTIVLTIAGCPLRAMIEEDVVQSLKRAGATEVQVRFDAMTPEERARVAQMMRQSAPSGPAQQDQGTVNPGLLAKDSRTQFIAIASGKGGVGKSTITVNLALALARQGKKVGVIDADIYGFSIPDMMGIDQRPVVIDNLILPVEKHGVKVMSMAFFVQDNSPIIWRGPMLGKMLRNFFNEIYWGEDLDFMLLDLPPGTGDVALDVHQLIPQCKEIIVTTPHITAAFVAARAGAMAIQTRHEVLGVVENMAYLECSHCGSKEYVFGKGGGERLAKELNTELLGQIPLGVPEQSQLENAPGIYQEGTTQYAEFERIAQKVLGKFQVANRKAQ